MHVNILVHQSTTLQYLLTKAVSKHDCPVPSTSSTSSMSRDPLDQLDLYTPLLILLLQHTQIAQTPRPPLPLLTPPPPDPRRFPLRTDGHELRSGLLVDGREVRKEGWREPGFVGEGWGVGGEDGGVGCGAVGDVSMGQFT